MRNPFAPQSEPDNSLIEALSIIMPVIGMFLMTVLLARSRSAALNTSIGRLLSFLALVQPIPAKEIMSEGELVKKVQELFDHKCPVTGGMAGGMATHGYYDAGSNSYKTINKLVIGDSGNLVKETANVACGTLLDPDLNAVLDGTRPIGWTDADTVKVYGCGATKTFLSRPNNPPQTPLADYITPCSSRVPAITNPQVGKLTCCNNQASKTAGSDKGKGFFTPDILKETSAHSEPMMFHDLFTIEKPHIAAFIDKKGGKNGKYTDYATNAASRSFHLVLYSNNGPCDVCKRRLIAAAKEFFDTFGADLKIYYAYLNTDHSAADEAPRPCTSGMMYGYGTSFNPIDIDNTKTVTISDAKVYKFAVAPLKHKVKDKKSGGILEVDSKKKIYAKLVHYPAVKRSGAYQAVNLGTNLQGYYEEYCDQLVSKVVAVTTGAGGYGTATESCETNYGKVNPYTKSLTINPTTHIPSFLDVILGVGASGSETFAQLLDCCSIDSDHNFEDGGSPDDDGDLDWLPTDFEQCRQEENRETWPCADALAAEMASTQADMFEKALALQDMNEEEKSPPVWDEEKTMDWVGHETVKHQQMICEIVGSKDDELQQPTRVDIKFHFIGTLQQSTSHMLELVESSCAKRAIKIGSNNLSEKQSDCESLLADACVNIASGEYKARLILVVAKACRSELSRYFEREVVVSQIREARIEKNIKSLAFLLRYLCEVIYGSHTRFSYGSEALYGEAENNERFIDQPRSSNGAGRAMSLVTSGLFKRTNAQVVAAIDDAAIRAQGTIPSTTEADEELPKFTEDKVVRLAHRKLRADSAPNVLAANADDTKQAHAEAKAHPRPMAA